jgi:hypothetical protein
MWANSVWGLAGFSFACLLWMLGVSDPIWRMRLMDSAILFAVASFLVLVWPAIRHLYRRLDRKAILPPIGTLRYVSAQLTLGMRNAPHDISGQITVEIHNDANKTIFFHAITAGNINDMPFDRDKVTFDGYISAGQSITILSKRLTRLAQLPVKDSSQPSFKGVYEYDLSYRYADDKVLSRRTARGIVIEHWSPVEEKQPKGTTITVPIKVMLYSSIEE